MRLIDGPFTEREKREMLNMLNGNVARICVSDDPQEIVQQLGFATDRLSMLAYSRVMEIKTKTDNDAAQ